MSIKNEIIDWIESKPKYWQEAIKLLIINSNISKVEIENLVKLCKDEFVYKKQIPEIDFSDIRDANSNPENIENVNLTNIKNIKNINALSETIDLPFENKLNIIYGDNGSGKSSLSSLLKYTCNTRGSKPKITHNLFNENSKEKNKEAEVHFLVNESNPNFVKLINETIDDYSLKKIDIFDSQSANHYIENEDEIAFIPQDLILVEKLAIVLKEIDNNLQQEKEILLDKKFDFSILEINTNSDYNNFLENIQYDDLKKLRENFLWNSEKDDEIESLKKKISTIKFADPILKVKNNKEIIQRFTILLNKLKNIETLLSNKNEIIEIIEKHKILKELVKTSSDEIFSDLPLPNIGTEVWKELWESARTFYNLSFDNNSFPNIEENAICPLCQQELEEPAKKRFKSFEEFIKNDSQKKFDDSKNTIDEKIRILNDLNIDFSEQEAVIQELNNFSRKFSENFKLLQQNLTNRKKHFLSLLNETETAQINVENKFNAINEIEKIIKNLDSENSIIQNTKTSQDISPFEKELENLIAQKKIFQNKPKIGKEICRKRKLELITFCIGKCNTRELTILSNRLTTQYITDNLKNNFKLELEKLNFKNIKIETETRGEKGKQYHYLRLDEPNCEQINLKDILSEGEHRCISLATFLSELAISEHKSAIIFDDPVSSLDHNWRNKIAKRIAEESKERQVIIFTHDITFLLMIQEHCEKLDLSYCVRSLTRKPKETGILGENPPWDVLNFNKRIGKLNAEHQILEKIEKNETTEIYNERIRFLYGKLRETWERFVEEVLFDSTIQRFAREIQTKRIKKVTDINIDDYNLLDKNMSKCSTYFCGHDSAVDLNESMPSSSEFLRDIKILENFAKDIRKRREKK